MRVAQIMAWWCPRTIQGYHNLMDCSAFASWLAQTTAHKSQGCALWWRHIPQLCRESFKFWQSGNLELHLSIKAVTLPAQDKWLRPILLSTVLPSKASRYVQIGLIIGAAGPNATPFVTAFPEPEIPPTHWDKWQPGPEPIAPAAKHVTWKLWWHQWQLLPGNFRLDESRSMWGGTTSGNTPLATLALEASTDEQGTGSAWSTHPLCGAAHAWRLTGSN